MRSLTVVSALALGLVTLSERSHAGIIHDFDGPGTDFETAKSLDSGASGSRPDPGIVAGGPDGNFFRLIDFRSTFGRYRTGLGFDQTVSGVIERVHFSFDFRITCAGSRTGFSGGGCADGFSVNFLNTDVTGTSGAIVTTESGVAEVFETGTPERTDTGALSVGFRTFDPGFGSFPENDLVLNFDNGGVGGSRALIDRSTLDLATGVNSSFGAFHHVDIDLLLGGSPSITLMLTDGTDASNVVSVYDGFDLSGVAGLAPYPMRINFGARVGDASMTVDLDNIEATFTSASLTEATTIPEPGTILLLVMGLIGAGALYRTSGRIFVGVR